jgi:hypothetical protein
MPPNVYGIASADNIVVWISSLCVCRIGDKNTEEIGGEKKRGISATFWDWKMSKVVARGNFVCLEEKEEKKREKVSERKRKEEVV